MQASRTYRTNPMDSTTRAKEVKVELSRVRKVRDRLHRHWSRATLCAQALDLRARSFGSESQYLFILGHMRSASSLLCQLLCTSDEIAGFGETHNNYRRRSDLAKLLISVSKQRGKSSLQRRYVLDK